jgi:hypothetical protein
MIFLISNRKFYRHYPTVPFLSISFEIIRKHRLQGGLLERYVAVFFALENIKTVDLSTVHQTWRKYRPGFLKKVFSSMIGR